ncbi:MAG: hypothetical protein ABIT21_00680 [Terrimesophilobacter sp.]
MTTENIRMLSVILAISAGAWVGGLAAVILVVVSSTTMGASDRVVLFRIFGRRFSAFFAIVGVFVVTPAVILAFTEASALTTSLAGLSVALVFATGGGIVQARRMSAMRTAVATGAEHESSLRTGATLAAGIRTLLVAGYVVLLVLAVVVAVSS